MNVGFPHSANVSLLSLRHMRQEWYADWLTISMVGSLQEIVWFTRCIQVAIVDDWTIISAATMIATSANGMEKY